MANSPSIVVLSLLTFLALFTPAGASSFANRAHDPRTFEAKALRGGKTAAVVDAQLERTILSEIEELLGAEHRQGTESRLARIEGMVRSTFASLEKNTRGNLDHASVRYALHRYFLQRHSWSVKGLAPGGDAWSSSSPTDALQGRVEDLVQKLFEKRLGARGLDLHEVAVLAATLENLIHQETVEHFNLTRASLRLPEDSLDEDTVDRLLDTYMMSYITGADFAYSDPEAAAAKLQQVDQIYPHWAETQHFVREVRRETLGSKGAFSFGDAVAAVEAVADRWGTFQDGECRDLKKALGQLEGRRDGSPTGRVLLSEFYGSAIRGENWQFTESMEYLRQIGALDETDASRPQVISTNYIHSPSNCVATSKFYEVCCTDECEGLMDHIEHRVKAPTASPEALLEIVAALPSATVPAGRAIAPTLAQRLRDIASTHGDDQVPIHGRLFAQWMHHAYPRECRFPHLAGTTSFGEFGHFMQSQQNLEATREEMERIVAQASNAAAAAAAAPAARVEVAPWFHEEELLADLPKAGSGARSVFRGLAFIALAISMGITILRTAGAHLGAKTQKGGHGKNCLKDHYL